MKTKIFLVILFGIILSGAQGFAQRSFLPFTENYARISSVGDTLTIAESVWSIYDDLSIDIENSLVPIGGLENDPMSKLWDITVIGYSPEELGSQYIPFRGPGTYRKGIGFNYTVIRVRRIPDPILTVGEVSKKVSEWEFPIKVPYGESVSLDVDPFFVDKYNRLYKNGVEIDRNKTQYLISESGSYELRTRDGANPEIYTVAFQLTFESPLPTYTISLSSNPSDGGSVDGNGTFDEGTSQTVSATANEGYVFTCWTENGDIVSELNPYLFLLTGDRDLIANFEVIPPTQYSITLSADPSDGGSVTGDGTFDEGTTQTVTAIANEGYKFLHWKEDTIASESNPYTFTLSEDRDLIALFEKETILTTTVTLSNSSGGSITTQVTAVPINGYRFVNWTTEDGEFYSEEATIIISNKDMSLIANFELIPPPMYTISLAANPSNGGTTSGAGTFDEGTTQTVSATANEGYVFTCWMENGTIVSTSSSYSFALNENISLIANFEFIPTPTYTISLSANPSNGGTTSGAGTFDEGTTQTVSATANEGYVFTCWMENGTIVSTSSSYSFSLNENISLIANFELIPPTLYTLTVNNGSGSGNYPEGTVIDIIADTSPSEQMFNRWTGNISKVADVNNASTTYTMGSENASVTATYKPLTAIESIEIPETKIWSQDGNIIIQSQKKIKKLIVYDLLGKVLYVAQPEKDNFTIEDLPRGQMIIIKLTLNGGETKIKKYIT